MACGAYDNIYITTRAERLPVRSFSEVGCETLSFSDFENRFGFGSIEAQEKRLNFFQTGFLWCGSKKASDFSECRALRARRVWGSKIQKPKIFWREDFLRQKKEGLLIYVRLLVPPKPRRRRSPPFLQKLYTFSVFYFTSFIKNYQRSCEAPIIRFSPVRTHKDSSLNKFGFLKYLYFKPYLLFWPLQNVQSINKCCRICYIYNGK